jgi:Tfp pilus assembly protein PilF
MGDSVEALNALQESLRLNPNCVHAMVNVALVYKSTGELDKAISILE